MDAPSLLVDGIGRLATMDRRLGSGVLGELVGAALVIEGGRVVWVGTSSQAPAADERLDVDGCAVLPGFVDSHTHLVFAGDRAGEWAARVAGRSYEPGGIHRTVVATRSSTDEKLVEGARRRAAEALRGGTTTLEVKSGYGLTTNDERRLLDVAGALASDGDGPRIEPTFLGAHVPRHGTDADGYVAEVTGPMLDACAGAARWVDAFCERGAFDADQTRQVLAAGAARGLGVRVHAGQLAQGPGVQVAAELGAAAADHLNHLSDADVTALADAGVVATLLPIADLCTRAQPPPVDRLRAAGVTLAVATDCNPGTSYSTSMALAVALAVAVQRLSPEEALLAGTAGGAAALRRDDLGRLAPGSAGDLVVLDAPSALHVPYRPGTDLVSAVVRGGRVVYSAKP